VIFRQPPLPPLPAIAANTPPPLSEDASATRYCRRNAAETIAVCAGSACGAKSPATLPLFQSPAVTNSQTATHTVTALLPEPNHRPVVTVHARHLPPTA